MPSTKKTAAPKKRFTLDLTAARVSVRLSAEHLKTIDDAAARLDLDRASFMRYAALKVARLN